MNKIILQFDDLFDRVKTRTELLTRTVNNSVNIIATDRDKSVFQTFFKDFLTQFGNDNGLLGDVTITEDVFIYEITEEEELEGMDKLDSLLMQIAEEYHLMRWFDALNQLELSGYRRQVYNKLMSNWNSRSTRAAIVTPTYRPYF